MERYFQLAIVAAHAHPLLALAAVGSIAFAESVAIVGTFVPAALAMFAAGALVGQGALGAGPTLVAAVTGAVAGDALSFEFGRRHAPRAHSWITPGRCAAAYERAEDLLRRRGAMAILVARFAGAVRAFVPLLAGIAHMPRRNFYLANAGSALLWAPVHLAPGLLFGGSLRLAEAVSGRLASLVLLVAALTALAAWTVARGARGAATLLRQGRLRAMRWAAARHGRLASLLLAAFHPDRPGSNALWLGGAIVLAAGWIFLGVVEDVVSGDPLVQADHAVFAFLQALRTPPADRVMLVVTEMGGAPALLPVIVVTALWLLGHRAWRTLASWIVGVAVAEILVEMLKLTLGRQRPLALYTGIERFSFPSGHVTMDAVVLGMLAFLLARHASLRLRAAVAGLAAAAVVMVALSRLYLGAHWLSDVVGGMSLGLAWVAFWTMVQVRRGIDEPLHAPALAALAFTTLVGATVIWHARHGAADAAAYAPAPPAVRAVSSSDADGGWPGVPRRRREFDGDLEEPFGLQWACAAGDIARAVRGSGWHPAPAWAVAGVLKAMAGRAALSEVPVLPRFDRGRSDALIFTRAAGPQHRKVLRLWRSESVLASPGATPRPIWYGAVYDEHLQAAGLLAGRIRLTDVESAPEAIARSLGEDACAPAAAAGATVLALPCRPAAGRSRQSGCEPSARFSRTRPVCASTPTSCVTPPLLMSNE